MSRAQFATDFALAACLLAVLMVGLFTGFVNT